VTRPASAFRATAALAAMELRITSRRGENILVTLIIPTAVLLFFASAGIVPGIAGRPVDFLLPGALSLAIIASGLVNLGIATAYERSYGVLKRLGGSPLPRAGLVAAKLASVVVLEILQVGVLLAVAIVVLGWGPGPTASVGLFLAAWVLGTLTFAGLGLLLAGTIRAEATLALANGLFLAFLMVGGIVLPIDHLPGPLEPVARLLPAGALSELFRAALGGATSGVGLAVIVLAAWAAAAVGLAVRFFRWE
jgi:ABC-2 type transport system permease protein